MSVARPAGLGILVAPRAERQGLRNGFPPVGCSPGAEGQNPGGVWGEAPSNFRLKKQNIKTGWNTKDFERWCIVLWPNSIIATRSAIWSTIFFLLKTWSKASSATFLLKTWSPSCRPNRSNWIWVLGNGVPNTLKSDLVATLTLNPQGETKVTCRRMLPR